jgi:hypothetical protein
MTVQPNRLRGRPSSCLETGTDNYLLRSSKTRTRRKRA